MVTTNFENIKNKFPGPRNIDTIYFIQYKKQSKSLSQYKVDMDFETLFCKQFCYFKLLTVNGCEIDDFIIKKKTTLNKPHTVVNLLFCYLPKYLALYVDLSHNGTFVFGTQKAQMITKVFAESIEQLEAKTILHVSILLNAVLSQAYFCILI